MVVLDQIDAHYVDELLVPGREIDQKTIIVLVFTKAHRTITAVKRCS